MDPLCWNIEVMRLRPVFAAVAALLVLLAGCVPTPKEARVALPPVPTFYSPMSQADHILVEKAAHRMTLFSEGRAVRVYQVALGGGGLGPKMMQGDRKVPEGLYRITGRNPGSAYHLSLRIGYPTPEQARSAMARGIDPGGDIMIHGTPNGLGWGEEHRQEDWTDGCIAVTDAEIEEIWRLVPNGTTIAIRR